MKLIAAAWMVARDAHEFETFRDRLLGIGCHPFSNTMFTLLALRRYPELVILEESELPELIA